MSTVTADETQGDQQDDQATQSGISEALTVLLLGYLAAGGGPGAPKPPNVIDWSAVINSSVGTALLLYAQRKAERFTSSVGLAGPIRAKVQSTITHDITTKVQDRLADAAQDLYEETVAAPQPERTQRIKVGSDRLAHFGVTQVREGVRYGLAHKVGTEVLKVWHTRRDSRVRPTHGHLEGEVRPWADSFTTFTGSVLRYPGDPRAALSETAGCRCRLSYRLVLRPEYAQQPVPAAS